MRASDSAAALQHHGHGSSHDASTGAPLQHTSDCSVQLRTLAAELIADGCKPLYQNAAMHPYSSAALLELAMATVPVSGDAPTPAFNLDDHFQILLGLASAARAVPEPAVHNLEVGSFAGHSLLLQAAALVQLGLNDSMVHSIDGTGAYGLAKTMEKVVPPLAQAGVIVKPTWHQSYVADLPFDWERPLRFFFEDSKHKPDTTNESFFHFERSVVEGGVIALHDVVCCANEYTANVNWLVARTSRRRSYYREIGGPFSRAWTTPSWESVRLHDPIRYKDMRAALIRSIDTRAPFRQWALLSEKRPPANCTSICGHKSFIEKLKSGYQWSTCRNTRIFERIVRQANPVQLAFEHPNGSRIGAVDACRYVP